MGFYSKKIIGWLLDPLILVLILLGIGLLWMLWKPSRRAAVPFLAGFLILLGASWDPLVRGVSGWIEIEAVQLPPAAPSLIVVLGTGVSESPWPTSLAALGPETAARLATGVEIAYRHPEAVLAVCGYTPENGVGPAGAMQRAAIALGIAPERIRALRQPRDTRGEAQAVAELVAQESIHSGTVWLVTSSIHLRRSRAFFRAFGIDPHPIAAEPYAANHPARIIPVLPDSSTLRRASACSHEVFGMLWALLRRQFEISDLK